MCEEKKEEDELEVLFETFNEKLKECQDKFSAIEQNLAEFRKAEAAEDDENSEEHKETR
ncbi:hypothetical protein ACFL43_04705 [Thermodesulfobacteriota bacterium]